MSGHCPRFIKAAAMVAALAMACALASCGASTDAQDDRPTPEPTAAQTQQAERQTQSDADAAKEQAESDAQSLAATMLFNGPNHDDATAPGAWGESGCDSAKDVRIIVVRGTDEPIGQGMLDTLANRIAAELDDHAQISALDYPASWESGSEAAGVNRLVAVLNAQTEQCPAQRTVLLGYSQGAMVVGDALSAPDARFNEDNGYELTPVARGHIVAVELYGDPRFRGDSPYASGDFDRARNGILGARGEQDLREIAGRTVSFCAAEDFACQAGGSSEAHGSYPSNGMIDQGVAYAVEKVKATL